MCFLCKLRFADPLGEEFVLDSEVYYYYPWRMQLSNMRSRTEARVGMWLSEQVRDEKYCTRNTVLVYDLAEDTIIHWIYTNLRT